METLKIEYVLTIEDLQAFDRYLWKGRRWIFWCLPLPSIVIALPTVVPVFSSARLLKNPEHLAEAFKNFGVQLSLPAVVVFLFWIFFVRQNYVSLKQNSPELFEKRTTEVTEGHLINTDPQGEIRTFWSAVKSVAQDETHMYIMFQSKEQAGFIIPKRAFRNSDDASLFFRTVYQYWKPGKDNPW